MKLVAEVAAADLENVSRMRRSLRKSVMDLGLPSWLVNELQLVYAELATNTVNHGTPPPRTMGLHLDMFGVWLRMRIVDDGGAFHDFARRASAIRLRDIAAKHESGLGLPLALELFEHLNYRAGSPNTMEAWRLMACRRPTILLLETDENVLAIYSRALRPFVRLLTAGSSEAADVLLQQHSIDVVLASLDIHAGDRWPCIEALSGTPALARPSLIFLTCDGGSIDAQTWSNLADCRVIETPATLEHLRHAMADLLRSKHERHVNGVQRADAQPSVLTRRHGSIETLIVSANPADGRAGVAVIDGAVTDRLRLVIAEGIRFGSRGVADCRALAGLVRHCSGFDPPPANAAALLAEISDLAGKASGAARPVCAVTAIDLARDGLIELASSSGRPAALLASDHSRCASPGVLCPAIGVRPDHAYETTTVRLEADEQLVLATESLHSAPPDGSHAMPYWIEQAIRSNPRATVQELGDRLAADVSRSSFGAALDWCVVVVRAVSNPASP